jgi:predicted PurR-regulated permease PerM
MVIWSVVAKAGAWFFESAGPALYNFSVSFVMIILIPIMSALILYHRKQFVGALITMFPAAQKESVLQIVRSSVNSYYNFIKGMVIVYLIVGIINSIGLAIIGIPHPFLFGFIAAILTIVPYAGIIIASLLPVAIAWITFNSIWYPIAVIALFAVVQYIEANIIFPMAVSSRLSLNMLVTLIAIIAGGILWGASGMILFIPFLSILKLIADQTKGMESLSRILDKD